MVTGSAAAFLVLETASHAKARGAKGSRARPGATGAARRRGTDTAGADGRWLGRPLLPALKPGYAVIPVPAASPGRPPRRPPSSPACAMPGRPRATVRQTTDLIGHTVEAAFPANLALAALAVAAGAAPQALVTGFGIWRGEALALVEPIPEGP